MTSLAVFNYRFRTLVDTRVKKVFKDLHLISDYSARAIRASALVIALLLHQQVAFAQTSVQKLPLYLPYSSSALPELATELDNSLNKAGIDYLKIHTADYWHPYQQGLRRGRLGIYFAAPHFVSWAIHKHQFTPFLRLTEPLKYVIAARREDAHIFEVNDLADRSICAQKAVNLDFLLATSALDNTLLSAHNKSVNSVPDAMKYDNQNCHAFAVSDHILRQFNLDSPERFIRLKQGSEYTNYAFVAHPSVPQSQLEQLTALLQTKEIRMILAPLTKQYSSKTKLVPTQKDDYPFDFTKPLKIYWGQ